MKKAILILITAAGSFNVLAQNINPEVDYVGKSPVAHETKIIKPDSMLSPWCIDINLMGGGTSERISASKSFGANYPNSLNSGISGLKTKGGGSFGFEAQVGYFFGHKKQFGVGAGLMYMYQTSSATLDKFHIEYQSTDVFGNTFRQELTANHQIKEKFKTSSFNIPIVFKYKTRISNRVGFTADAGLLINIVEKQRYNTNAAFDYEAVYQYVATEGGIGTVYDNSPTPASGDLVITKSRYLATHDGSTINDYFNSLSGEGYNVGLGVKAKHNTGSVSMGGSVGLLLRPAISVYLSDMVALNFGAYYIYQAFNHKAQGNYMITDKAGDYNSVLNNAKSVAVNNFGVSAGVRIFLPHKERDEIVIPDLPTDEAAENDNTPEPNDVHEIEPAHIDISTPILFDFDKSVIKRSGYSVLDEAVKEMISNPDMNLVIHGYADNIGNANYNKNLSKKRANAVKNYLKRKGVRMNKMKAVGHGEANPAANNHTRAGRAQNRRVIMKVNDRD